LHDAVSVGREQHALQPLALLVVNVPAFRRRCLYARTQHSLFCPVFSKKFNIIAALFIHQSPALPQKIDSRGGLFWC